MLPSNQLLDGLIGEKMKPPTKSSYREALIRRRIKFVAEKGSMARLFKAGTNSELQEELYNRLTINKLESIGSAKDYDDWLISIVENTCWKHYSREDIEETRWAYFAKLINIIIYEILSNRELIGEKLWGKILPYLHLPIDSSVTYYMTRIDPEFPGIWVLKGMSKEKYMKFQREARKLGVKHNIPPIWFEAAYSS